MTNRVIGIDKTEIINIDILAVDKTKLNQDIYEGNESLGYKQHAIVSKDLG